jgi:hypothetical protein
MTSAEIVRMGNVVLWSEQPKVTTPAPKETKSFRLSDAFRHDSGTPEELGQAGINAWQLTRAGFKCALVVSRNVQKVSLPVARESALNSAQFNLTKNTPDGQAVYLGPAVHENEGRIHVVEDSDTASNFGFWLPRPNFVVPCPSFMLERLGVEPIFVAQ